MNMKEIKETDERWLCILFDEPHEAEFQSGGIHEYDRDGGEIHTYTAGVGWYEKESKAETAVHGGVKVACYDAFRAARQEINAGCMEAQDGFDTRA